MERAAHGRPNTRRNNRPWGWLQVDDISPTVDADDKRKPLRENLTVFGLLHRRLWRVGHETPSGESTGGSRASSHKPMTTSKLL